MKVRISDLTEATSLAPNDLFLVETSVGVAKRAKYSLLASLLGGGGGGGVSQAYVDAQDALRVEKSGDTMTGLLVAAGGLGFDALGNVRFVAHLGGNIGCFSTNADDYAWWTQDDALFVNHLHIANLAGGVLKLGTNNVVVDGATTSDLPEGSRLYFTEARVDARLSAQWRGLANGLAALDGTGKVPKSQLPDTVFGQVEWRGVWNAATNTLSVTLKDEGFSRKGEPFGNRLSHAKSLLQVSRGGLLCAAVGKSHIAFSSMKQLRPTDLTGIGDCEETRDLLSRTGRCDIPVAHQHLTEVPVFGVQSDEIADSGVGQISKLLRARIALFVIHANENSGRDQFV
jgi:hypothetical protein